MSSAKNHFRTLSIRSSLVSLSFVLLSLLVAPAVLHSANDGSKDKGSFLGASTIEFSQVGQSKVPVFSSIDGYVCFFLTADVIRPAKRKVAVFSIPKYGLAVSSLGLDFRHLEASAKDWSKILSMVEPLQKMDLVGAVRLKLPERAGDKSAELISPSMPIVHDGKIHLALADPPNTRCVLAHDAADNQISWQFHP